MNITATNLSEDIISKIGLRLSGKPINAEISHDARVFEYPHLTDVFIMENDLYGNVMPIGSCFLVFCGRNGLIGKEITVEKLKNSSPEEIENLVNSNIEG